MLDETHDVSLRSWVDSANRPESDFPLQNLPFGVFRQSRSAEPFRIGVGIGDQILDLAAVLKAGGFGKDAAAEVMRGVLAVPVLNDLMAAGPKVWSALRLMLSRALRLGSSQQRSWETCLLPQAEAEFALPARIGDYTDFYTSIHHATAVGRMFRPDNPLLPNYKWMPIGYHGRSSSIGVSGQTFRRPVGQITPRGALPPMLAPSARLDYELELGVFIGAGNELGSPICIDDADSHVFGLCLLNDWSARDLQAWEYQPLGPFLAKNFATTISPWIVTLEALQPYRVPWTRPVDDPAPLPYLDSPQVRKQGGLDIHLEVWLSTDALRCAGAPAYRLSRSNARHAYWNLAQMVAHHTINGCNLQPGDLLGTGTQSGPEKDEAGSLLELSNGGKQPLALPNGETRGFLEDGDTVIMRGWCERTGAARIGFGELLGSIRPALADG
ncbi:MAG TPA: fumarylacetoacetase [Steroidobacteraceae bacterium]